VDGAFARHHFLRPVVCPTQQSSWQIYQLPYQSCCCCCWTCRDAASCELQAGQIREVVANLIVARDFGSQGELYAPLVDAAEKLLMWLVAHMEGSSMRSKGFDGSFEQLFAGQKVRAACMLALTIGVLLCCACALLAHL
jgi:hypothetical protein